MQHASEEYRGYKIVVLPFQGHDDLWDFEYKITRQGDEAAAAGGPMKRCHTAGGHLTPEAACLAGVEVARTEVDNLLALEPG